MLFRSLSASGNMAVGREGTYDGAYVYGYISNLRLVVGNSVYSSNFTPPTAPLTAVTNTKLLTCQSNKFIDNSSINSTLTRYGDTSIKPQNPFQFINNNGKSYYFDGTGDYLVNHSTTDTAFGTNDFTMESWVYRKDSGVQRAIIDTRGGVTGILFYLTTNNLLNLFDGT